MTKPQFARPVQGTAPNQFVSSEADVAALNRTLGEIWDAAVIAQLDDEDAADLVEEFRDIRNGTLEARDRAQDWAEGAEPGGAGTRSAKGWAEEAETALEGALIEAGEQADAAAASAAASLASAASAGAARDAAFVNAQVFAHIADGLSGTAPGDQFQVVEEGEIVRYLHRVDGTALEAARYPSAGLVSAMGIGLHVAGVIRTTNLGGTGDAITAEFSPAMIDAGIAHLRPTADIEFTPVAMNLEPNPTITIGPETYGVRTADGHLWPAGGFIPGRSYRLRRRDSILRVITGDVTLTEFQGIPEHLVRLTIANLEAMDGAPVEDVLALTRELSQFHLDAGDVPEGNVTSLTTEGTNPVEMVATGGGNSVQKVPEGIEFSTGQYLRWAVSGDLALGPFRRAVVVLDVTLTEAMSGTVNLVALQMNDTARQFRVFLTNSGAAGALITLQGPGNAICRSPLYKQFGERQVMGFEIDYLSGAMVEVDPDGYATHAPSDDPLPLIINELRLGQNARMILHRAAVFTEAM